MRIPHDPSPCPHQRRPINDDDLFSPEQVAKKERPWQPTYGESSAPDKGLMQRLKEWICG